MTDRLLLYLFSHLLLLLLSSSCVQKLHRRFPAINIEVINIYLKGVNRSRWLPISLRDRVLFTPNLSAVFFILTLTVPVGSRFRCAILHRRFLAFHIEVLDIYLKGVNLSHRLPISLRCLHWKDGEKKPADGGEKKVAAEDGGKKNEEAITAVLKLDLHCEGCAKKVRRAVSHFEETTDEFPQFISRFSTSISKVFTVRVGSRFRCAVCIGRGFRPLLLPTFSLPLLTLRKLHRPTSAFYIEVPNIYLKGVNRSHRLPISLRCLHWEIIVRHWRQVFILKLKAWVCLVITGASKENTFRHLRQALISELEDWFVW